MNRPSLLLSLLAVCVLSAASGLAASKAKPKAAPSAKASQQQIEEYTRLQILLDNANFGPGKIDGHDGTFTRKALALFRKSQGQPDAPAATNSKAPPDTNGLDMQSINPVFIEYEITKEDAATVGPLPSGPEAQSKVKSLPYATLAEAIAEKFHCDIDFLKKLNPGKAERLKPGDKVLVPNVKPFEISEVKALKPGSEAANIVANEFEEPAENSSAPPVPAPEEKSEKGKDKSTEKDKESSEAKPAPQLSVHVSVAQSMLEVRDGDKVVAAFPVTVGSSETASPIGQWKVRAVAKFPNFRYDKKMLMKGERSSDFKMLPAGPNNPVGIMWIALNKKGIGLHGTNDPDSIGRSASHGCIRLANWDVVKLAGMVKPSAAVTIE
jgi:lipoprotein-anchoring transpeptidase ErfK/SrfK